MFKKVKFRRRMLTAILLGCFICTLGLLLIACGEDEHGDKGVIADLITVKSVEKTNTDGVVDTYQITFSDNTTSTFTVTNGTDWETIHVSSVEKTSSAGLVDTYTITFSDKSTYTFTGMQSKRMLGRKTAFRNGTII